MRRKLVLVGLLVFALSRPSLGASRDASQWSEAGWGLLAVTANIFYVPAKIVYAGVGAVTGGLAYLLTVGDLETAQKVWSPSVGGNYVITPAMLQGEEPILFNGKSYSTD